MKRWIAQRSNRAGAWHQVVVEGGDPTEPVAMAKDFRIAQAIALLPQLAATLQEISEGRGTFSLNHAEHAANTIREMKALAQNALAALAETKAPVLP